MSKSEVCVIVEKLNVHFCPFGSWGIAILFGCGDNLISLTETNARVII